MVVMSCDYPWAELVRKRGAEFAYLLPRTRAEILATPELLSLAADYLLSRADVDSSRFAAVGASLGVPPVAAWAARDTRARAVALLYGGADLGAILEANLGEDIRWPALRAPVAGVLGFLLRPLEPAATVGGIAPRPLLVAGADSDQWIPRRSVELMFAAAREPKQLVWFGGEHLRTTNEALIAALGDTTAAWLSRVLP
jgi:dienelactone hydrolase